MGKLSIRGIQHFYRLESGREREREREREKERERERERDHS
jgi:hypothetical protein